MVGGLLLCKDVVGVFCSPSRLDKFTVDNFFLKTDKSAVVMPEAFHAHLMLCQHDTVTDRELILLSVENFNPEQHHFSRLHLIRYVK